MLLLIGLTLFLHPGCFCLAFMVIIWLKDYIIAFRYIEKAQVYSNALKSSDVSWYHDNFALNGWRTFGEVMASLINEQYRITNQDYIVERKWPLALHSYKIYLISSFSPPQFKDREHC